MHRLTPPDTSIEDMKLWKAFIEKNEREPESDQELIDFVEATMQFLAEY